MSSISLIRSFGAAPNSLGAPEISKAVVSSFALILTVYVFIVRGSVIMGCVGNSSLQRE